MTTWSKSSLQSMASPLMKQLIFFHDHTLLFLTMIMILVRCFYTNIIF